MGNKNGKTAKKEGVKLALTLTERAVIVNRVLLKPTSRTEVYSLRNVRIALKPTLLPGLVCLVDLRELDPAGSAGTLRPQRLQDVPVLVGIQPSEQVLVRLRPPAILRPRGECAGIAEALENDLDIPVGARYSLVSLDVGQ